MTLNSYYPSMNDISEDLFNRWKTCGCVGMLIDFELNHFDEYELVMRKKDFDSLRDNLIWQSTF